jgi:asparagine synthase (glutamine-hydrolysing)
MQLIGAVLGRQNRPVDAVDVASLLADWQHADAATRSVWRDGGIGLACSSRPTLPAARETAQPHLHSSGVVAVADVRIDNRDELTDALRCRPDLGDLELLAECYLRWGEGFAGRVIGDVAAVLWDPRSHTLVVVTDAVGLRSIFVSITAERVAVASEIRQLLALPWVPRELDLGHLAEVIEYRFGTEGTTVAKGIELLSPGTVTVFGADGSRRSTRYWQPSVAGVERVGNVDAADRFLEVFTKAVVARCATDGDVACEVSGGLDSSSIAAVTARHIETSRLHLVAGESDQRGFDERRFIDAMQDHLGLPIARYQWESPTMSWWVERARFTCDVPPYPDGYTRDRYLADLAGRGTSVLLGGLGGDQHFDHDLDALVVTAVRRPWVLRTAVAHFGRRPVMRALARVGATATPPGRLLLSRRRLTNEPRYLSTEFASEIDWITRTESVIAAQRRTGMDRVLHRRFASPEAAFCFAGLARTQSQRGVETRLPFLDRRLIDLVASMPWNQRATHRETRVVHRRAVADLLPLEVATRRSKARFDPLLAGFFQTLPSVLTNGELVRANRVKTAAVVGANAERSVYDRLGVVLAECVARSWQQPLDVGSIVNQSAGVLKNAE